VNFLSHYYFDRRPKQAHFNFGLLFPDLVRNFIKGAKFKEYKTPWTEPIQQELFAGCLEHVLSDKIFHNWEGFIEAMDFSNGILRKSAEPFQKDFFISHILVELVIDKILLNRHDNLAEELYEDYSQVNREAIRTYLSNYNINEHERFFSGFDRFMEVQYLRNYKDFSNIVYALGRICTKMRLQAFTVYQKKRLELVSAEIESFIEPKLIELKELLTNEKI